MNVHDSRRIEEVLAEHHYVETHDPNEANLILFNTCSVREKAEHKLLSVLGTLRSLKSLRPDLVLCVAGCVAQQEGDALLRRVPWIDIVLGPDNIPELPLLIERALDGHPPIARTVFDVEAPAFLVATAQECLRIDVSSFVTVMKGCDERCTFCVVPYTRGPERYRPADDIVHEIRDMARSGTREITLLGQTVNSWFEPGTEDTCERSQFAGLLTRIACEVPELSRLRYTSPHPRHVTDELVAAHRDLPVLARHVHLPMQSGSNRVLKRMLRRYTRETYLTRAQALLDVPGLTLSTDIIVGFPGETRADFEETLSLVREVGFVSAFAFKYSQRPHTPALKLEDDVSEEEKDARLTELLELTESMQKQRHDSLVGTTQRVLVEDESSARESDAFPTGASRWRGRTEQNEIVHFDLASDLDPWGMMIDVTIDRAFPHSLHAMPNGTQAGIPQRGTATRAKRVPLKLPVSKTQPTQSARRLPLMSQ